MAEAITPVKVIAIVLAFAGLCLVFGLSLAKFSLLGLALAGVNGIASAAEVSTTKKSTQKYSTLLITTYAWIAIFITHLPLSLLTHERQWAPALDKEWFAMVAYAPAGMLAFWLVVEGFKFVDASIGSLVGLLEIVWGVLFGVWFFHEHAGPSVLVGGVLIIIAGMLPDLINILQRRQSTEALDPPREI